MGCFLPYKKRIFLILVNWNGWEDTLECIASLQKVPSPAFQILIVDNGSTNDSVAKIRKAHPEILLFETKENLGFAGGNNVAIEWALERKAEWICLLNNDTTVDPPFLSALLKASEELPQAKLLGSKLLSYQTPSQTDHLGGMWNPKKVEFTPLYHRVEASQTPKKPFPVDFACAASLLIHRSVFESIGLLEPSYFLFWEESDFCMRAKRKGFQTWIVPSSTVYHKINASFTGGKAHTHYFWWRSRLLFLKRNFPHEERTLFYQKTIRKELLKMFRHFVFRSIQSLLFRKTHREKERLRLKAGLLGSLHYLLSRFGNCPRSLCQTNHQKMK